MTQIFDGAGQDVVTDGGTYVVPDAPVALLDQFSRILTPTGTETGPDNTLSLFGIVRSSRTYGPLIYDASAVTPDIEASLFSILDGLAVGTLLANSLSRSWQDPLSEPGAGSITLMNDDPDLAMFAGDGTDLVTMTYKGQQKFTLICEQFTKVSIAQEEESRQATTWSGRGHLALLERMLVYPTGGVGRIPVEEDRYFDWTSGSFDDSSWLPVTILANVAIATIGWPGGWPVPFPDATASVLGTQGSSTSNDARAALGGEMYIRQTITVPARAVYELFVVVDNVGEIFIDGQLVSAIGDGSWIENETPAWFIDLGAGEHVVAVHVVNFPQDGSNPMGAAWVLYDTDASGSAGEVIAHSDSTAVIVEYPAVAPGMTVGQVMILCLAEGMARLVLPGLTWSFTVDVDSDGNPWPLASEVSTKVGTDVLTFFRELAGTYIDFRMRPGTLILDAWVLAARGEAQPAILTDPTDPNDAGTGNITTLTHTGET